MKVIVAPDSYKGNMTSCEVADHIENGIKRVFSNAEIVKVPMADGGEGTVEAMVKATNGRIFFRDVMGPLGEKVRGYYGILGDGETAVVEIAAASGLPLIPKNKLNPAKTTTYGTGELIKDVLNNNIKKLIVGLGGSGTNDGGAGIAQALGVKLKDKNGFEIGTGGISLKYLSDIDISDLDKRLNKIEVLVACDVNNPLCGPEGASFIYGPQKGATPEMVIELDNALRNYEKVIKEKLGVDLSDIPGAGAAGGVGGGLVAFLGAKLQPGIKLICDTLGFLDKIQDADLVITGEGKVDKQTAYGKTPVGIASYAKMKGIPVFVVAGMLGSGYEIIHNYGIDALFDINPRPMALEESIAESAKNLELTIEEIMRVYSTCRCSN